MGLSSTSALIGLGLVIIAVTLLVTRKQRKLAMFLLILGLAFIVLPYSLISFFLD